ncbi:MAG: HNH endonuclease [Betaproteobacteria bacterium]|nr:HNH endonuclease [Betaproteobacteria bacterium]
MSLEKPLKLDRQIAKAERRQASARHAQARRAKEQRAWQQVRAQVYERDRGRCRVCQTAVKFASSWPADLGHTHHLRYRSAGGDDSTGNLVLLCGACHRAAHAHRIDLDGDGDAAIIVTRRA